MKRMLSVVIVSYNCLNYLRLCIDSIRKYNDIGNSLEVIVVDNSTNSETMEWLQGNCPDVIAIKNQNHGYGQANNVGAAVAKGEYLLFLNPDTELVEPIFQFAIEKFKQDKNLGCFGVKLINAEGREIFSYGMRAPFGMEKVLLYRISKICSVYMPSIMWTSGADIFISKELFEKCGAFDEAFFLYREEADLCNRVNQHNKKTEYFPRKKIIHHEGQSTGKDFLTHYVRCMSSNRYYCKKYGLDYLREGKKEYRYCFAKYVIFSVLNKNKSKVYKDILNLWKNELKEEKRRRILKCDNEGAK